VVSTNGARRRYTIKDNPQAKVGKLVVISFRVPAVWAELLDAEVTRDPEIDNRTDAMQDALMCWLLLQGVT
jgi:hypothetical protein